MKQTGNVILHSKAVHISEQYSSFAAATTETCPLHEFRFVNKRYHKILALYLEGRKA